jgi:hypothetical protein
MRMHAGAPTHPTPARTAHPGEDWNQPGRADPGLPLARPGETALLSTPRRARFPRRGCSFKLIAEAWIDAKSRNRACRHHQCRNSACRTAPSFRHRQAMGIDLLCRMTLSMTTWQRWERRPGRRRQSWGRAISWTRSLRQSTTRSGAIVSTETSSLARRHVLGWNRLKGVLPSLERPQQIRDPDQVECPADSAPVVRPAATSRHHASA